MAIGMKGSLEITFDMAQAIIKFEFDQRFQPRVSQRQVTGGSRDESNSPTFLVTHGSAGTTWERENYISFPCLRGGTWISITDSPSFDSPRTVSMTKLRGDF